MSLWWNHIQAACKLQLRISMSNVIAYLLSPISVIMWLLLNHMILGPHWVKGMPLVEIKQFSIPCQDKVFISHCQITFLWHCLVELWHSIKQHVLQRHLQFSISLPSKPHTYLLSLPVHLMQISLIGWQQCCTASEFRALHYSGIGSCCRKSIEFEHMSNVWAFRSFHCRRKLWHEVSKKPCRTC